MLFHHFAEQSNRTQTAVHRLKSGYDVLKFAQGERGHRLAKRDQKDPMFHQAHRHRATASPVQSALVKPKFQCLAMLGQSQPRERLKDCPYSLDATTR